MRVICVDANRRVEDIGNEPLLQEGFVYQVDEEVYGTTSKGSVVPCYKLSGIDLPHVYVKNRFVVCSDMPDEVQKREKRHKEKKETPPLVNCIFFAKI